MSGLLLSRLATGMPSRPRAGLCHDRYDFYPLILHRLRERRRSSEAAWSPGVRRLLSSSSSIYRNPSFEQQVFVTRIRLFIRRTLLCKRMSAVITSHLHARHVIRIVLVPLFSPNGERSIKRGLGWVGGWMVGGGFKRWRMIQRGSHFMS